MSLNKIKTVEDWRKKILYVIELDRIAIPGRAGETPISDLASYLSRLDNDEIAGIVIAAISDLVSNPPVDFAHYGGEKNYFQDITFLLSKIKDNEKKSLSSLFYDLLFSCDLALEIRTTMLRAFMCSKGSLTIDELNKLQEIKDFAPLVWLSACFSSGHQLLAKQNAIELIALLKININLFLPCMFHWQDDWDENLLGKFQDTIIELRNACKSNEDKSKFDKWLIRWRN